MAWTVFLIIYAIYLVFSNFADMKSKWQHILQLSPVISAIGKNWQLTPKLSHTFEITV